jgi:hypothetical protein
VGLNLAWGNGLRAAASQPFAAVALSASPIPLFGAALESYVFANARPFAPRDGGFRAALTFTPRPWFVLDAGADLGWFPSTHGYGLFAGMTFVPAVFWHE